MKRQIELKSSTDVTTKKSRVITSLEDLSNELFYEIFDYLDGCDINKSFSNLNHRFENLLKNSSLPLTINLTSKSEPILEKTCRQVIIPNKHRLISLNLETDEIVNNFFDYCIIDSSFNHLQSIFLNDIPQTKMLFILFSLNTLPRLSSLNITLQENDYDHIIDIYRLIFQLPHLKYNKLSATDIEESNIIIPMAINENFSPITHLIVNLPCNLNELTSILLHTPYLQHLHCRRLVSMEETYRTDERLILLDLTHMFIGDCSIPFNDFEVFIKKISLELHSLSITTYSYPAYLDADRWVRLITNHMPYLRRCSFDHRLEDFDDEFSQNYQLINQFTSSFWTEKQWVFELKNIYDEYICSIHPYRKQWFDDYTDHRIISYSNQPVSLNSSKYFTSSDQASAGTHSPHYTSTIQLTLGSYVANTAYQPLIEQLKSFAAAIQFTYLNIQWRKLTISILMEIIHLLPNLNSLKISFLPAVELNRLNVGDSDMLLLVSISNKITKVKLEQVADMEQIQFLMDLCPRMQYFEIDCRTEYDLVNMVKAIPMKNITHISHLDCLCLCILNATDRIVESLDTMIYFERRLHNDNKLEDYILARRQNKIFLKWKLPPSPISSI